MLKNEQQRLVNQNNGQLSIVFYQHSASIVFISQGDCDFNIKHNMITQLSPGALYYYETKVILMAITMKTPEAIVYGTSVTWSQQHPMNISVKLA